MTLESLYTPATSYVMVLVLASLVLRDSCIFWAQTMRGNLTSSGLYCPLTGLSDFNLLSTTQVRAS